MKLFKAALGIILENIINSAIRTDLDHSELLKIINSQRLAVFIKDFNLRLIFIGRENKLEVIINNITNADAEISGNLLDLLKLAFSETPQAMLASKIISLKGEVSALQNYQQFISHLDLDWEGRLSDLIGPIAAREIGQMARKSREYFKNSYESTTQDLSEFLTEEIKLLPSRKEVEIFYQDLRTLRLDTERFEAKLKRHL